MTFQRPMVTGAGGFIGSHLVFRLLQEESIEQVICVDVQMNQRLNALSRNQKVKIVLADLNQGLGEQNFGAPDFIFSLAALNGTGRFYSNPFAVLKGSILPTLNILDIYAGSIPILYSSSSEVYASTVDNFGGIVPTPEEIIPSFKDVRNPRWSYGAAKLLGEIALLSAGAELGAVGTIVRYHNVYGPDMGVDHFVPDFISRARKDDFTLFGADQTRAFLHIDDAVEGTILAARAASNRIPIYHLGTSEELTIKVAAEIIMAHLGKDPKKITALPAPAGSVNRRCADINLASAELGWSPTIDFRTGISRYLNETVYTP